MMEKLSPSRISLRPRLALFAFSHIPMDRPSDAIDCGDQHGVEMMDIPTGDRSGRMASRAAMVGALYPRSPATDANEWRRVWGVTSARFARVAIRFQAPGIPPNGPSPRAAGRTKGQPTLRLTRPSTSRAGRLTGRTDAPSLLSAKRKHRLGASTSLTSDRRLRLGGISFPTAGAALENLARVGVVRETTGRKRGRFYAYTDYLTLLDRGTKPLPA